MSSAVLQSKAFELIPEPSLPVLQLAQAEQFLIGVPSKRMNHTYRLFLYIPNNGTYAIYDELQCN